MAQALNFDPFAVTDVALGVLCGSAVSSYLGIEIDEVIDNAILVARSSDDTGYSAHVGRYSKLSDDRVKKKKLNDYKKGLNVMKSFVSPHNN